MAMGNPVDVIRNLADDGTLQMWVVAIIMVAVTAVVGHFLAKLVRRITSSDGVPLPSSSILVNIVRIAIWVLGISVMLSACFNVDVNGLVAAIGVGGIALSLGLQDTIKNFIGGLQVTLLKILQPGDHVVIGAAEGIVQDVTWRQTTLKDYENNVHIIPNAVINSTEITKVQPPAIVVSTIVLNNDCQNIDEALREMEQLAKCAIEKVTPLEKDPWILLTQIGEYGAWAKLRFVLADTTNAREARDAALRAVAPYTR